MPEVLHYGTEAQFQNYLDKIVSHYGQERAQYIWSAAKVGTNEALVPRFFWYGPDLN